MSFHHFVIVIHVMEALFGTEQYIVSPETTPLDDRPRITIIRDRDGAWTRPFGARYTRVSGVWVIDSLRPWTIAYKDPCLYHNPWANYPYSGQVARLSEAIPIVGQIHWKNGIHPRDIFALPDRWPE